MEKQKRDLEKEKAELLNLIENTFSKDEIEQFKAAQVTSDNNAREVTISKKYTGTGNGEQ